MQKMFERAENLLGKENIEKLRHARVLVFGLGGVGSFATEALARAGIGTIGLVDNDKITESNLNRQLYALRSTIGQFKTDLAEARIKDINPETIVRKYNLFYLPETSGQIDLAEYDYIIDAIDTMAGKIELVERAEKHGVPLICCMGTGNKLNPSAFEVTDIYATSVCPVAKVMRAEVKKRGVKKLKVVFSKELPRKTKNASEIGSVSFVPPVAGFILAGEAVKDLLGIIS